MTRPVENKHLTLPVRALFAMKNAARASASTLSPSLNSHAGLERNMSFDAITGGFRQNQAAGVAL